VADRSSLPSEDSPSPGGPARFALARDGGERAVEINDFYNRCTRRSRPLDAYRWEWLQTSLAPAAMFAITEAATGRLVATNGYLPTPLVRRGRGVTAVRTENTLIDPVYRKKLFYLPFEKRARAEVLKEFQVIYTVHCAEPLRPLRVRLGYQPVGWWVVYLPKLGAGYLRELLKRARNRVAPWVPDAVLSAAAAAAAGVARAVDALTRRPPALSIERLADVSDLGDEYVAFWRAARPAYDITIDRSPAFLEWRIKTNPHLRYHTWVLRAEGRIHSIVIGHTHGLGRAHALYVDDIIVGRYEDVAFAEVLACLPALDPGAEGIVFMTLALDTPLHRALRRAFPFQARCLDRFGKRLFDEMFAYDRDGECNGEAWYVTPIFSEGMDTSRPAS
jgi:hypothetical protein